MADGRMYQLAAYRAALIFLSSSEEHIDRPTSPSLDGLLQRTNEHRLPLASHRNSRLAQVVAAIVDEAEVYRPRIDNTEPTVHMSFEREAKMRLRLLW